MKEEEIEKGGGLPENAFRPLKPGETYNPLMSPDKVYREVTPWSVIWGVIMAVIFSAASAYNFFSFLKFVSGVISPSCIFRSSLLCQDGLFLSLQTTFQHI